MTETRGPLGSDRRAFVSQPSFFYFHDIARILFISLISYDLDSPYNSRILLSELPLVSFSVLFSNRLALFLPA